MVWHAQSDGFTPGMLQARVLACGRQYESIRSGRISLEQTVVGVAHARILRHFGKVAAHKREIVIIIHAANAADAFMASLSPIWQPRA